MMQLSKLQLGNGPATTKATPNTWSLKIDQLFVRGVARLFARIQFIFLELSTDVFTLILVYVALMLNLIVAKKTWQDLLFCNLIFFKHVYSHIHRNG